MFRAYGLSRLFRNASVIVLVAGLVGSAIVLVIGFLAAAVPASAADKSAGLTPSGLSVADLPHSHPASEMERRTGRVQLADGTRQMSYEPLGFGASASFEDTGPQNRDAEKEMPPGPWFIGIEPLGKQDDSGTTLFQDTAFGANEPAEPQGASLRFGHLVTPQGFLFGDLGYQRMAAETRISLVDVPPFSDHDFDGLSLGLGGHYAIGANLLMQADFTFKLQEDSGFGAMDLEPGGSVLRFGMAYQF